LKALSIIFNFDTSILNSFLSVRDVYRFFAACLIAARKSKPITFLSMILVFVITSGLPLAHGSSHVVSASNETLSLLRVPSTPMPVISYQSKKEALTAHQDLHEKLLAIVRLEKLSQDLLPDVIFDLDVAAWELTAINSQILAMTSTYNIYLERLQSLNKLVDYKLYELYLAGITLGEVGRSCVAPPILFKISRGQMYQVSVACFDTDGEKLETDFMLAISPYNEVRNLSGSIYPLHPFNGDLIKTKVSDTGLNHLRVSYHIHIRPMTSILTNANSE